MIDPTKYEPHPGFEPHPDLPALRTPDTKARAETVGIERVIIGTARLHRIHKSWGRTAGDGTGPATECYECAIKAIAVIEAVDEHDRMAQP